MINDPDKIIVDSTQRYSCVSCEDMCCSSFSVPLDKETVEKLETLDVVQDKLKECNACFTKTDKKQYFLPITPDKTRNLCIFYDPNLRCIIHNKHGFDIKPVSCKIFPFAMYFDEDDNLHLEYSFRCKSIRDNYGEVIYNNRSNVTSGIVNLEKFPSEYPLYNQVLAQKDIFKITETLKNILSDENKPLDNCVIACYETVSTFKNLVKSGKPINEAIETIKKIPIRDELPKAKSRLLSKTVLASYLAKTLIFGAYSRNNPMFTNTSLFVNDYLKLYLKLMNPSGSIYIPALKGEINIGKLKGFDGKLDDKSQELLRRYLKASVLRGKALKQINKDLEFFNRLVYYYTIAKVTSKLIAISENRDSIEYEDVSRAIAIVELGLYHFTGDILYLNNIENLVMEKLKDNFENLSSITSLTVNELG